MWWNSQTASNYYTRIDIDFQRTRHKSAIISNIAIPTQIPRRSAFCNLLRWLNSRSLRHQKSQDKDKNTSRTLKLGEKHRIQQARLSLSHIGLRWVDLYMGLKFIHWNKSHLSESFPHARWVIEASTKRWSVSSSFRFFPDRSDEMSTVTGRFKACHLHNRWILNHNSRLGSLDSRQRPSGLSGEHKLESMKRNEPSIAKPNMLQFRSNSSSLLSDLRLLIACFNNNMQLVVPPTQ